jgi:hypothetical protein
MPRIVMPLFGFECEEITNYSFGDTRLSIQQLSNDDIAEIPLFSEQDTFGLGPWPYLRTFLIALLGILFLSGFLHGFWEGGGPSKDTVMPPADIPQAILLAFSTASSVNMGNIGATTLFGKFLIIIDSLIGFCFLGISVWVIQFCIGENKLEVSKWIFFTTNKTAKIAEHK